MALQSFPGDTFEVTFLQTLHGQEIRNVRHYELLSYDGSGVPTLLQSETALAAEMNEVAEGIKALQSQELVWQGVKIQRISPGDRDAGLISDQGDGAGAVEDDALPSSVAAVIRLRTELAGRRNRGRIYIAGLPFEAELNSTISLDYRDSLIAVANDLFAVRTVTSGGRTWSWKPVLLSKASGGVFKDITSADVDPNLRTQRRRQVGKGA